MYAISIRHGLKLVWRLSQKVGVGGPTYGLLAKSKFICLTLEKSPVVLPYTFVLDFNFFLV